MSNGIFVSLYFSSLKHPNLIPIMVFIITLQIEMSKFTVFCEYHLQIISNDN